MDYLKAVLILLVFRISMVKSIRCFVCNSLNDPSCETVMKNDTSSHFLRPCEARDGQQPFCRKTKFTLLGDKELTRVSRSCGWIIHKDHNDTCIKYKNDYKDEMSCQCFSDYCNGSDVQRPNLSSLTLWIFVVFSRLFI